MFSPDGTLISASAAPHCGAQWTEIQQKHNGQKNNKLTMDRQQTHNEQTDDKHTMGRQTTNTQCVHFVSKELQSALRRGDNHYTNDVHIVRDDESKVKQRAMIIHE